MDELRKYINDHKEEGLDSDNPPDLPWERIYSKVRAARAGRTRVIVMRNLAAASVVILLGVGIYLFTIHKAQPGQSVSLKETGTAATTLPGDSSKLTGSATSPSLAPTMAQTMPDRQADSKSTSTAPRSSLVRAKTTSPLPRQLPSEVSIDKVVASYKEEIAQQETNIRQLPVFAENLSYVEEIQASYKVLSDKEQAISSQIATRNPTTAVYQDMLAIYEDKITILGRLKMLLLKLNTFRAQGREPSDSLAFKYLTL